MKNNHYNRWNNKLNKKNRWILILIVIFLLGRIMYIERVDFLFEMTKQFIPLLTYEKECGNQEVDYASEYQVPDWFYEDELEGKQIESINYKENKAKIEDGMELASENDMMQKNQAVKNERVTTLSDGVFGVKFTRKELKNPDFLLHSIFNVDANTYMSKEELNVKNLLDQDISVEGLKNQKKKKILIYHTHGSESFIDSREGVKEDTIIGVGSYLAKILEEEYGISVYHDETVYDVIDGKLDRSKAYENSYHGVKKILKENPSIEVAIDLHRDGVDEETHLVTEINGKKTAKIMFLNGVSRTTENGQIAYLENPNQLNNLAFSFQMYLAGREHYDDYVRKIYVRSYRYNLHLLPRTTLIEAGAQNNTIQEEKNAMEPLAAILDKVLSKEE